MGQSPVQSTHKLLASFVDPYFHTYQKKGRVTDDLTLLWMPLSDPQLKTMLPMLRCVRKVQTQLPGLGRNDP